MLISSMLTDEQKAALKREFFAFMGYKLIVIAMGATLCFYMIFAEEVKLRLVAFGFGATFAVQILGSEYFEYRTNRILGTARGSASWIPRGIQIFLAGLCVSMMWIWAR